MEYAIFKEKPEGFIHTVEAAGCYLDCQGKILLLLRHPASSQGNTWGIPAGKLEEGEDPESAVLREVAEEVGLSLHEVAEIGRLYVSSPVLPFIFHMFYAALAEFPTLRLSDEHTEARWVTPEEARCLPLIRGAIEALACYENFLAR